MSLSTCHNDRLRTVMAITTLKTALERKDEQNMGRNTFLQHDSKIQEKDKIAQKTKQSRGQRRNKNE